MPYLMFRPPSGSVPWASEPRDVVNRLVADGGERPQELPFGARRKVRHPSSTPIWSMKLRTSRDIDVQMTTTLRWPSRITRRRSPLCLACILPSASVGPSPPPLSSMPSKGRASNCFTKLPARSVGCSKCPGREAATHRRSGAGPSRARCLEPAEELRPPREGLPRRPGLSPTPLARRRQRRQPRPRGPRTHPDRTARRP